VNIFSAARKLSPVGIRFWPSRANGHLEFHALDLPLGLQSHWVAPHQPAVAGFWVPIVDLTASGLSVPKQSLGLPQFSELFV
jgi:hypothetical protein